MSAFSQLPNEIRSKVLGENAVNEEEAEEIFAKFLEPLLQSKDKLPCQNKTLFLDKQVKKKWPKPIRHHRKKLTYHERRKLGLYSLGRESLKYEDLLPLHSLWKDYMKNYIDFRRIRKTGECDDDMSTEQIAVKLYRADYHGAELNVKRSNCPGYVGKCGIVAMETKNCFLLVGKDNITRKIPKSSCQFTFQIDQFTFSFFGKNFASRPADRSSKKIKRVHSPDL